MNRGQCSSKLPPLTCGGMSWPYTNSYFACWLAELGFPPNRMRTQEQLFWCLPKFFDLKLNSGLHSRVMDSVQAVDKNGRLIVTTIKKELLVQFCANYTSPIQAVDPTKQTEQCSMTSTVQQESFTGGNFWEFQGFGAIRESFNRGNFHRVLWRHYQWACHCCFPQFAKVLIAKVQLSAICESFTRERFPLYGIAFIMSVIVCTRIVTYMHMYAYIHMYVCIHVHVCTACMHVYVLVMYSVSYMSQLVVPSQVR